MREREWVVRGWPTMRSGGLGGGGAVGARRLLVHVKYRDELGAFAKVLAGRTESRGWPPFAHRPPVGHPCSIR